MGQSKNKLPVLEIGLDISTRPPAAHLDLTKPPDLGNLLKGIDNNISSVLEFHRRRVLKSKLFGQESTCHQGRIFKKILRVMTVCQKMPKSYFQSQFWMSKINQIFSKKKFI